MEIDGATARWKRSGSAAVSMSRCRLRAARGQRGLPLCRVSPHRDNEGWSAGKDVQSSLTVCVPSELSPVSSVTIQLLWPPSAPPLSSWSLSQPVTHTHTHGGKHACRCKHPCVQPPANMHSRRGIVWNVLILCLHNMSLNTIFVLFSDTLPWEHTLVNRLVNVGGECNCYPNIPL